MKTLEHFWYLDHSHSSKTKKLREDSERGNNFIIRHGLLPYNNYSTFGESYAISLQTSTFTKMPTTMIQKLKNYEMLLKWKFGVKKKCYYQKTWKYCMRARGPAGARGRPPHAGAPAADSRLTFLVAVKKKKKNLQSKNNEHKKLPENVPYR